MKWNAREAADKLSGNDRRPARRLGFTDRTDYEQRNFVNLAATAFVLALALGIGWTVKALDRQIVLDKCLDSGRKECRQVTDAGVRGFVKLNR